MMLTLGKLKLLDGAKADNGRPLRGGRIAARKYVRADKIGSIWVNPAWNVDHSRSLWEPLAYSPSAIEYLCEGIGLERDPNEPRALPYREALETLACVLVTQPNRGVLMPEVEGEREVYVLWADEVVRIHPYVVEG